MSKDNKRPSLLIVDDDDLILELLTQELSYDYDVVSATERPEVGQRLLQLGDPPACALVDLGLPPHTDNPREGLALIRELTASAPSCAIIVMSGQNEQQYGKIARTLGAIDFVSKPCDPDTIRETIERALKSQTSSTDEMGILGHATPIANLRRQLRQFGSSTYPVLISGESGTGKELAAKALHAASNRSGKFIALNCAGIPEHLFESNLFGAKRGSYTDATSDIPGHVVAAEGGTLFLDEIGDLPLSMQPKLLRLLENNEFLSIGDSAPKIADVRIIAATNSPLQVAIKQKQFRADLYHRLSVLVINTPALRTLGDDRNLLLETIREQIAKSSSLPPFTFDDDAQNIWNKYGFPGNVRELRNIVTRLQINYPGTTITKQMLDDELLTTSDSAASLDSLLEADARSHARSARSQTSSDQEAASQLGISVKRLQQLINEDLHK